MSVVWSLSARVEWCTWWWAPVPSCWRSPPARALVAVAEGPKHCWWTSSRLAPRARSSSWTTRRAVSWSSCCSQSPRRPLRTRPLGAPLSPSAGSPPPSYRWCDGLIRVGFDYLARCSLLISIPRNWLSADASIGEYTSAGGCMGRDRIDISANLLIFCISECSHLFHCSVRSVRGGLVGHFRNRHRSGRSCCRHNLPDICTRSVRCFHSFSTRMQKGNFL